MDPTGSAPAPDRAVIRESWERARLAGLRPSDTAFVRVADAELRQRRTDAVDWLALARGEAGVVSSLLQDLPHVLCVADRDGILLHCVAQGMALGPELGLLPGFDWSEARTGTSGVATAAATGQPVVVAGPEHFRTQLQDYTCTAAPVRGPDGQLLGVVNLTTSEPAGAPGRFALVQYLAGTIGRALAEAARQRGALASSAAETERARRELLETEEQFRTLADTIPHLAWMADARGWIFWYNQRWFEYTGLTLPEAQGWGWRAAHHPDHVERVVAGISAAWEGGEPWEDTFPLRGADGEYRWFLSRALPIRDIEGRVVRWFGTNTDVTAQVETEQALRLAQGELELLYQQAQSAVAERDEAVAVVSHDLRAPLNVLGMAAHLLLEPHLAPEQKQAQAEAVARVVGQMSRLVSDLLEIARSRTGGPQLQPAAVSADVLLREAHQLLAPLAEAASVELALEPPDPALHVQADRARMLQVFSNLLENALDHTPAGGRVTVRAEACPDGVRFEVRDSGNGIPEEQLPHIFERFWQGNSARGRGVGLGLAICKMLIEAHGGWISVASAPGRGTTFAFSLPAAVEVSPGATA